MNLFDYIDIYCERTNFSIWNEPVNVITNIIFLAAAWHLHQLYVNKGKHDPQGLKLIILIAIIGFGSALFHIFANVISLFADVVPIICFVFYYLWIALQRFLHWRPVPIFSALAAMAILAVLLFQVPPSYSFNGSIVYFPCLVALLLIGRRLRAMHHEAATPYFIAATWFVISLFFRMIDIYFCNILFIGTHFLWHLCNGVVIYILTKEVIERPPLTLR